MHINPAKPLQNDSSDTGVGGGVEQGGGRVLIRSMSVKRCRAIGVESVKNPVVATKHVCDGKGIQLSTKPKVTCSNQVGCTENPSVSTHSSTPPGQYRHQMVSKQESNSPMISLSKPHKPYPDFPLFAHANGYWAKKIKGKLHYFGKWDEWEAALEKYNARTDTKPKPRLDSKPRLSVFDALNLFLNSKLQEAENKLIEMRTYKEHRDTCSRFVTFVGPSCDIMSLQPKNFSDYKTEREKTCNLVSVGNEITRVRSAFNWLIESKLIKSVDFGPTFRKPPMKAYRKHKREQGKRMFAPEQIHLLLDEAGVHMRAMIYLGINCGFGPADCAMLPIEAIDFDGSWIVFPRPKTEIDRECPLWPETVEALKLSLSRRFKSDDQTSFFVRPNGKPWSKDDSELSKYFTSVRRRVLPDGGMYWLRRTFETIGGRAKDQVGVDYIMGHLDDTMAAIYRQDMYEERLVDITNYVRKWLGLECS